jgi:hypothetical protein
MYKKDYTIIVYILFMLLVSSPAIYGMNACRYQHEDLQSGDFTPFVDNMVQRIIKYLYTSLPDDCTAESFIDSAFRARLRRSQYNNQKGIGRLDMTCKRFILLQNPCMIINKVILSNLIFELLRPSRHNKNTASHIKLCINAGADINYYNEWNESPLIYAISTPPCRKFTNLLITWGADVNHLRKYGINLDDIIELVQTERLRVTYEGTKKAIESCVNMQSDVQATNVKNINYDDDEFYSSSANDSGSESFLAHSTSSDNSSDSSSESESTSESSCAYYDSLSAEENDNLNPLPPSHSDPIPNTILNPDADLSSSSESADSKDNNIHKPQPPVAEPTAGGVPHNPDGDMFTTVLHRICANPLPTLAGIAAVGGVCYWAYKKYKAYKASQKQLEQPETAEIKAEPPIEQLETEEIA